MTLPIGGADMPVVISIYNAFTGLAVGLEGFVLQNPALMIAGMVVGAAGLLLTLLMAKAMNRSVANVLFTNFGDAAEAQAGRDQGQPNGRSRRPTPASRCATPASVIIVPGYGLAAAQGAAEALRVRQAAAGGQGVGSSSPSTRWPAACRARWTCCWPRPACPTT